MSRGRASISGLGQEADHTSSLSPSNLTSNSNNIDRKTKLELHIARQSDLILSLEKQEAT